MENIRVSIVPAKTGRVVLARILCNTDFVTGIIEACRQSGIITGSVQSAIGSLKKAEISWAVPSTKTKRGSERSQPLTLNGPLDFLNGQGIVCLADPGKPAVHFHGVLCDSEGKVHGGHFFPGGNPVHSTMDIVIMEIDGAWMNWEYDPEIDLELPVPRPL